MCSCSAHCARIPNVPLSTREGARDEAAEYAHHRHSKIHVSPLEHAPLCPLENAHSSQVPWYPPEYAHDKAVRVAYARRPPLEDMCSPEHARLVPHCQHHCSGPGPVAWAWGALVARSEIQTDRWQSVRWEGRDVEKGGGAAAWPSAAA